MRKEFVEKYKYQFENYVESWKSFGADLVDAGSPNPCSRSATARKVLGGRWQEAYADWLKDGEFSLEEELYVGFILATEAIFHRRPSAPVPELPKRIWNDAEYKKSLKRFEDVKFWREMTANFKGVGTSVWSRQRNELAALLEEGKTAEAESLYHQWGWDQHELAESYLAQIRMTSYALGEWKQADKMWFFVDELNRIRGPIPRREVKSALESSRLMRTTYVWTDGMKQWQQASRIACFFPQTYTGPVPPALPGEA